MITLRADQAPLKDAIYNAWQEGNRNVLLVLPTGGGKSVIVSTIAREIDNLRVQQAIIAHRQELVGQMSLHIARQGTKHRIIAPRNVVASITAEHRAEFGRSFIDPAALAAVAGVDTLIARKEVLKPWLATVGYWTTDEAHHVLRANKWGEGVSMFPNARGLGVTATPLRADGYGLGADYDGVFNKMIIGPTMRQLIDIGALTDYQIVVPKTDFNIEELRIGSTGEYTPASMREAAKHSRIVGDVVQHYLGYALGKQAVVFATDVETSNEMAERFNACGISAVSISSKTDDALRVEYIRRFRAGQITVLVNVDLFGEGFDLPAIEVVIMARPTMSLAVYLQQFGRALRIMAGKRYGLIIDCVSNVKVHGLPDRQRIWTLTRREKRSKKDDEIEIPVNVCKNAPACGRAYSGLLRACPYCGHVPVPVGGGRSIDQVDGDLMLLDLDLLKKMRENIVLESPSSVGDRTTHAAGAIAGAGQQNRQVEKIEAQTRLKNAIAVWAGWERSKGFSDPELQRKFYFGASVDVLTALAGSRVEMDKLLETVNGWVAKNG